MPVAFYHIFYQVSFSCWCLESKGTLLHIFLECPKLKESWTKVQSIKTLMGVSLGGNSAFFLLHDTSLSNKQYKNSQLGLPFNATKACISALWKSPNPPDREQRLAQILEIKEMENLTIILKEQEEELWKIWTPYFFIKIKQLLFPSSNRWILLVLANNIEC